MSLFKNIDILWSLDANKPLFKYIYVESGTVQIHVHIQYIRYTKKNGATHHVTLISAQVKSQVTGRYCT